MTSYSQEWLRSVGSHELLSKFHAPTQVVPIPASDCCLPFMEGVFPAI